MPEETDQEEIGNPGASWKGFLFKWGEILPAANTEPLVLPKRSAIRILRSIREVPVVLDYNYQAPVGSIDLVERDGQGVWAELTLTGVPPGRPYPILTNMEADFRVIDGRAVLLVKYSELIGIGWIRTRKPERKPTKRRRGRHGP